RDILIGTQTADTGTCHRLGRRAGDGAGSHAGRPPPDLASAAKSGNGRIGPAAGTYRPAGRGCAAPHRRGDEPADRLGAGHFAGYGAQAPGGGVRHPRRELSGGSRGSPAAPLPGDALTLRRLGPVPVPCQPPNSSAGGTGTMPPDVTPNGGTA